MIAIGLCGFALWRSQTYASQVSGDVQVNLSSGGVIILKGAEFATLSEGWIVSA